MTTKINKLNNNGRRLPYEEKFIVDVRDADFLGLFVGYIKG